jgi:ligand-binding sensor domain-containing protein/DNA-binding response OmpR family regulator/nitrogen-specific signal transduction histidine kinase
MKRIVLNRKNLLLLLCSVFFLFVAANVPAIESKNIQDRGHFDKSLNFRHYTVENGLTSNIVRSIIQDKRGFIWIGTEEGLNCFDGINIKNYLINTKNYKPLGSNYINFLVEDKSGKIWIATDAGIYTYDYITDSFSFFNKKTQEGESVNSMITNISIDQNGNLWFSTYGQGVLRFDPASDKLKKYLAPGPVKDQINYVYSDADNQIWICPKNNEMPLARLSRSKDMFENFPLKLNQEDIFTTLYYLLETSNGDFWLGTWDDGIRKLDRNTGLTKTMVSPRRKGGVLHIHSLFESDVNEIMIGSDDGFSILNTKTGDHKLYSDDETNANSLSNKFVYPIIRDKEGGIWIGTYYGGVNYISPKSDIFKGFSHSSYRNSVCGNIISRFCEDNDGNIWIGTDDGGLSCYSPQYGTFTNYTPNKGQNSISYHNVHALCLNNDELWIGTYSGGLNVLNLKTKMFRKYFSSSSKINSLDGNSIYAIFKDSDKKIWVTSMTGINLYRPETDDFKRVLVSDFMTIDIKQDRFGYIWFATQNKGLYRCERSGNKFVNYRFNKNNEKSLPSNQTNALFIDTKGELWIGTSNGLCKFNYEKNNFDLIPLSLPSKNICSIIESDGIFWLTTTRGLASYNPVNNPEGKCMIYTKSDGLQSNQMIINSALKSSDGNIYIGTLNGFNIFNPKIIRKSGKSTPVVFTNLEILNKDIQIDPEGKLTSNLNNIKKLVLTYKENVFSIKYAALSFITPERFEYAYMLEGFDVDWNYVGHQNKATYTNLHPGKYVFKVKARDDFGAWCNSVAELNITVKPPFYLSFGFKLVYFLLICISIYYILTWLKKKSEKKHREHLLSMEQEKEREVHKSKIEFFTMIAHEIRTPVSLIIGPLQNLLTSDSSNETTRKSLNIIERNSQRLLALVNQLLDFRKVEENGFTLSIRKYNLHQLVTGIVERFRPSMESKSIEFIYDCENENEEVFVDQEAMTKILSNLLSNAIKFTNRSVKLRIFDDAQNDFIGISVTDDGPGIPANKLQDIFKPFYQVDSGTKPGTGIGLNIVKNLTEALGGLVEVESDEGVGTTFCIKIPINRKDISLIVPEQNLEGEVRQKEPEKKDEKKWISPAKSLMMIVDDNEDMIDFLAENFIDEFHLMTAKDGIEALDELKNVNPDIIISDLMMPNMNGIELCSSIRSNMVTSHIPFILLTAKTDLETKTEGITTGADMYVEKPFSIQYLKACVNNLISSRNLLKKKFSEMPSIPLKSVASNKTDEDFLVRINEIIESNISNADLSVDLIAKELCISRSGLFAKIKSMTDITPNELIQLVRLKQAAILLQNKQMRINEVAYAVGFNNPSYFSKCFQKQFGVRPMEYASSKTQ